MLLTLVGTVGGIASTLRPSSGLTDVIRRCRGLDASNGLRGVDCRNILGMSAGISTLSIQSFNHSSIHSISRPIRSIIQSCDARRGWLATQSDWTATANVVINALNGGSNTAVDDLFAHGAMHEGRALRRAISLGYADFVTPYLSVRDNQTRWMIDQVHRINDKKDLDSPMFWCVY